MILKDAIDFYIENSIGDIVFDNTINHFDLFIREKEKRESVKKQTIDNKKHCVLKEEISQDHLYKEILHINSIDDIKSFVLSNLKFNLYKENSTNTVICSGNENPDLIVLNYFPTEIDDLENDIITGNIRELMMKMLNAIDQENNALFLNNFFWKLDKYKMPTKDELNLCKPVVERIIALAKPKAIVALGANCMSNLLGKSFNLLDSIGKFMDYKNYFLSSTIPFVSIYHPAFLLKQTDKKREVWETLKKVKEIL